jgi:hypothetical protein
MTKMMQRGVLAATLVAAISGVAVAGAKWGSSVTIDLTNSYASGTLGKSRNSVDTQQYIGCYTYALTDWRVGVCVAVNAKGQAASCQVNSAVSDSLLFDQIVALNGDSHLYFAWDKSGYCTAIQSENFSMYEPKQ